MTDNETPGIGDNGAPPDKLKSYVKRAEDLIEIRKECQADIARVFAEAKGEGFDTKVIRKIIKLREMGAVERAEQDTLLETYRRVFEL